MIPLLKVYVALGLHSMVRTGLLFLALALGPSITMAQVESTVARAVRLNREALADYKAKRFEDALKKFTEANQLSPNPVLDLNIGRCYQLLEQPSKAIIHCKIALNARKAPDKLRQAARRCVEKAEERLALPVLDVDSIPPGATVRVDGQERGRTPWTGEVQPGRRQVDISMDGHRTFSKAMTVGFGTNSRVIGTLVPLEVGALLTVTSVPQGSTVALNGQTIGETPLQRYPVDARSHAVEVFHDGYVPEIMTISIGDGNHLEQNFSLVPVNPNQRATWRPPVGWSMVGVGALSMAIGGVFGYRALRSRDTANDLATTDGRPEVKPQYDKEVRNMNTFATTADALFTVGLLGASGGLFVLVW